MHYMYMYILVHFRTRFSRSAFRCLPLAFSCVEQVQQWFSYPNLRAADKKGWTVAPMLLITIMRASRLTSLRARSKTNIPEKNVCFDIVSYMYSTCTLEVFIFSHLYMIRLFPGLVDWTATRGSRRSVLVFDSNKFRACSDFSEKFHDDGVLLDDAARDGNSWACKRTNYRVIAIVWMFPLILSSPYFLILKKAVISAI